jgi:hypothetical protein
VNRDATPLPRRQRLAPFAVAHDEVENAAQPTGVDRIRVKRGAVVWIIDVHRGKIELARIAQQLPQIFDRVLAARMGKLVGERAHRKGVRDVVNRSIPSDPDMAGRRPILATHVRDRIGHVGDALLELAGTAIGHVWLERRFDRRKHRPMVGASLIADE